MTTLRDSPSGPLVETSLEPIDPQRVLANPEAFEAEPIATSASDVLDFVGDTPTHLLIRGLGAWQTQDIDAIVHPSLVRSQNAAKFWLIADGATKAILDSYNVASTADGGAGIINVTLDVAMVTANFPLLASIGANSTTLVQSVTVTNQTTTGFTGQSVIEAGSGDNPDSWSFAGFGSIV